MWFVSTNRDGPEDCCRFVLAPDWSDGPDPLISWVIFPHHNTHYMEGWSNVSTTPSLTHVQKHTDNYYTSSELPAQLHHQEWMLGMHVSINQEREAGTWSRNVKQECAAGTWSRNVKQEHEAGMWSRNVEQEREAGTWSRNVKQEREAGTWSRNVKQEN